MPPYLGNIILVEKMVRRPHGPLPYPDQYFIILTIASSGSADFHGGQMGMSEYSIIFAK